MWQEAFLSSAQSITYALLCKHVLSSGAKPFERVSAALAVRAALASRHRDQTLLIIVPAATAATARHIAAGLLVGNFSHANASYNVPADEHRPLFRGDLLFVTPSVTESIAEIRDLAITPAARLTDFWDVVSLSRYTAARTSKLRVYVANPGWFLEHLKARRFGAIIIDASHPRTSAKLPALLTAAASCSSIRLAVAPPLLEDRLKACGHPADISTWFWDPQAMEDAKPIAECGDSSMPVHAKRQLIICDTDSELDEVFANVQKMIIQAIKQSGGRSYPGITNVCFLLNRLRQLSVPLAELEEIAARTWAGGLRKRVEELGGVEGFGQVTWELTWPALRDAVETAYRLLLQRSEPAKFWSLASHLSELLEHALAPIGVIVSSQAEAQLLSAMLQETVDNAKVAIEEGRLLITTLSVEERLVADGWHAHTLLLGPRPTRFRYLDVFAPRAIEEFVYPFEVDMSKRIQERLYAIALQLQEEKGRLSLLSIYGFEPPSTACPQKSCYPSPILIIDGKGREMKRSAPLEVSGALDLDQLLDGVEDADGEFELEWAGRTASFGDSPVVNVTFAGGTRQRYYSTQKVDVFFHASGVIERRAATELKQGWYVITFVDDRYDSLFGRLQNAIVARLSMRDRIALELWDQAKGRLLAAHPKKRALYETLLAKGLTSTYEAFAAWFVDDGTLAPQRFDEFLVVADTSKAYASQALMERTFRCVQHQRGRNRAAGRALRALLRATVSGEGYEEALESARTIDPVLADTLAAVETREVESVQAVERRN